MNRRKKEMLIADAKLSYHSDMMDMQKAYIELMKCKSYIPQESTRSFDNLLLDVDKVCAEVKDIVKIEPKRESRDYEAIVETNAIALSFQLKELITKHHHGIIQRSIQRSIKKIDLAKSILLARSGSIIMKELFTQLERSEQS
jgi:hypothetical protein